VNFAILQFIAEKVPIFKKIHHPSYTLLGFDLTTHMTIPLGGDDTTRPRRQGIPNFENINFLIVHSFTVIRDFHCRL
jgi:hypothetical protein